MTLNWGPGKPEFEIGEPDPTQNAIYRFNVKGRLAGGAAQEYRLEFKAFVDGMECTDFGQGNVATVGFQNGRPILETDQGLLEVLDNSLEAGCKDCLRLIDEETKKVIKSSRSPSWSLGLVKLTSKQISYDTSGSVYVIKGEECLRLNDRGYFSMHRKEKCPVLEEVGNYSKPYKTHKLEPGESLFKLKGTNSLLFLSNTACT